MILLICAIAVFGLGVYLFFQLPAFGAYPKGVRLERIEKSPNYKNGSFMNLTDTPMSPPGVNYFTMLRRYFAKTDEKRQPDAPVPHIKSNLKLVPSDKPTFTYFGHSAYMIQIGGKNLLMDPVFSERISPVSWAGGKNFDGTHVFEFEDLPKIDFVILSHDHYDHMDYETLKKFAGTLTQFIVPLGVGAHLERWGIVPESIIELDWWEQTRAIEGMQLTATPARHFSGRGFTRGKSLWASYVLESEGYKVFLGGDSGYEYHFAEIGKRFGPFDLAILECGQYNEMWPYIHMMPEQTAQAGVELGAAVVWPVHWGKFTLAFHAWNEPIQRITKKANELNLKLTTPKIGEQIILNEQYPNDVWWEEGQAILKN
jgi:L-ascorbate metabolism protein UlaG (beta-lactamase superfamily)